MAWLVNQQGHREYYAVPRALHGRSELAALWTNIWISPAAKRWLTCFPGGTVRRLRDYHHEALPSGRVRAWTAASFWFEFRTRFGGRASVDWALARNRWWDRKTAEALRTLPPSSGVDVFFTYSYGMGESLAEARRKGWRTVYGQIDPGLVEERKVAEIARRWPAFRTGFKELSADFYERWRDECALADRVVVNSEWSADALSAFGIPRAKIAVVPLVYDPPPGTHEFVREYPARFSMARPLRVLFLGQCILRKGVAETIETAQRLAGLPIEFSMVGNTDIHDLPSHLRGARIVHTPRVARGQTADFFRAADIFVFPTHSDGFGLTQLEAQSWKLPIVTSPFCGRVVRHGETGWVIPEVTSEALVAVLREAMNSPDLLRQFSRRIEPWPFTLDRLGTRLVEIAADAGNSASAAKTR
jgi:glycosyltransferase involved in cell wall biosynthesis